MGIKSITKLIGTERLSNYVVTFGVEFLIMLISVALFKIIALHFHEIGFSEYTVNKRLISFLMPLLMIGLGVSLPKFLSVETKEKQLEIHYSALIIVTGFFLVSVVVGVLFSTYFSKMVFGDYNHEKMCIAVLFFVYSLMVHACLYNYFRGKFNFKISSLMQFIDLGLLPILVVFFVRSIFDYFIALSLTTLLVLLIVNIFFIPFYKLNYSTFKTTAKRLFGYGLQRMPGDVILGLFLAVPTFIASNYFSLIIAGNIAFCLSLFNIIIALMSPVNIILLPEASRIVHERNFSLLKSISSKLLLLSFAIGVVSLTVISFFGKDILQLFSIKNYEETSGYLILVFSGVIGYSIFSVIRSIIDAYYVKARTSVIIIISFLFFLVFLIAIKELNLFTVKNTLIGFSVSINFLGVLTYWSLTKIDKAVPQ